MTTFRNHHEEIEAARAEVRKPQLFLRTTDKDGKSYGGFQWPMEIGATVTAPDWKPNAKCGNGLHGLLNGEGDASHLSTDTDAIWWIVEAVDAIDLGGKHKFQNCKIVAFGSREEITPQMRRATGGAVNYLIETGGHHATLTGGDHATLTGGHHATLTGGDHATLTGGYRATLIGGDCATLTGGHDATLTGGDYATLTGGHDATLTGGRYAILTGGYRATLIGGDSATLTGGDSATLTGGRYATLVFLRWVNGRRRVLTAYVGENGIKSNTPYRANYDFTAVDEVRA